MKELNLHNLKIKNADYPIDNDGDSQSDFSYLESNETFEKVEVLFKNLENSLINIIEDFKDGVIFGCVAWLTSEPILKALANCRNVQIIVQKEDFLRPDLLQVQNNAWKTKLQNLYSDLRIEISRTDFEEPVNELSLCQLGNRHNAIRCVGNYNKDKVPAFPRMHHKFLVFCKIVKNKHLPVKVWTGSFNLTNNAAKSFENAIVLTDNSGNNAVLNSFKREHHQIYCLSEELNWSEDWSTPEFRIGT